MKNLSADSPPESSIVLVDDEPSIIAALKRELRPMGVKIHTFTDPNEALNRIEELAPSLVLSDVRMPGVDGIRVLEQAAKLLPNTERVLLSGHADLQACIDAINLGHVHFFLQKPWDSAQLLTTIKKGLEHANLRKESERLHLLTISQNEQLERWNSELEGVVKERTEELMSAYSATIRSFSHLIEKRMRGHGANSRKVIVLCSKMADKLGLQPDEQKDLRYAALLRNMGKLSLSDDIIDAPYFELLSGQVKEFHHHPTLAALAISGIPPLSGAAKILEAYREHINGEGYPAKIFGQHIPTASQILMYASDYYDALSGHLWKNQVNTQYFLDWAEDNLGERYSAPIVHAGKEILELPSEKEVTEEQSISINCYSLREGMVLSQDIISGSGVLLLAAHTKLDDVRIRHLLQLERNSSSPLKIYIEG